MNKRSTYLFVAAAGLAVGAALAAGSLGSKPPRRCDEAHRAPHLSPDYTGLVIPPNIAPLNFVVQEPGTRYFARLFGRRGRAIEVAGRAGVIAIPLRPWQALLAANRGGDVSVDVYVRGVRGRWAHFDTVRNRVAAEEIDSYLVYRWFRPAYTSHTAMGLYQRDLRSFDESCLLRNNEGRVLCMNCHNFLNRRPDTFFFHVRGPAMSTAMVLVRNGRAQAIDTRTAGAPGPAAYSSWHPTGEYIAFSRNWIRQYFREAGDQPRDALDARASLWLYRVKDGRMTRPPTLNPPGRMPTFPCWSADGHWLYFCSTARTWPASDTMPIQAQPQVRYDLMRAPFHPETESFGAAEMVLSARETGRSLLEPRLSPDGRFLLFCECAFGSFPVFQKQTDLYLLDLQSKERRAVPLEGGGGSCRDSWHSWSGNSRWIVFSRKKDNGLLARPYLRYIDAAGHAAKAFVLPQEDPTFYDRCTTTYNVPELVSGPVRFDKAQAVAEASRMLERTGTHSDAGAGASVP